MEEDISRTVEAAFDYVKIYDNDKRNQFLYEMGALSQRLVVSINIRSISRNFPQVGIELQDVPHANTFQSKGRHSSVSLGDLSERWNICIEQ